MIHRISLCTALFTLLFSAAHTQDTSINPAFEQVLSLRSCNSPVISNSGKHVAFSITRTDWKENRYDTEIWLSKDGGEPFQLTYTPNNNSFSPKWSPDDSWIAFLANREDKTQIHVIRTEGGEAFQVSNIPSGVQSFEWSPDGRTLYFTSIEEGDKKDKTRQERYGAYEIDEADYKLTWLYALPFDPQDSLPTDVPCYDENASSSQGWPCDKLPEPVALIDSVDFTIRSFSVSPDGQYIAFTHSPDPFIISFMNTDIGLLDLRDTNWTTIIQNKGMDNVLLWSPDSDRILFTSNLDDVSSNFYKNAKYFIYNIENKEINRIGGEFDENLNFQDWNPEGLFATANIKTEVQFFKLNLITDLVEQIKHFPSQFYTVSFSDDGRKMAFLGNNGTDLSEVYRASISGSGVIPITKMNEQIRGWKIAQSEVVSWKSKDGVTIEGVVHKPLDFDATKKYPLLVMIHGGPTGVDRPAPVFSYVYPVNQWLNKGAVVLRVNYRGSAGYGEAFRSLNVENLGIGDSWDVLSGVDFMTAQGYIDETRMGCMGWSQGGYISAFLTTTSDRFKAISVGAGISNWMTYYVNTDIHPFTRQYLKANPWENEDIYKKTSPMTYINNASTPTLIQHGEFDQRVPVPNAYELLQGLKDNGVPSKLIIYKGFGHGITKPKERLAAVWHNWQWFNQYIWNEETELLGLD